jgi:hypothetical protein
MTTKTNNELKELIKNAAELADLTNGKRGVEVLILGLRKLASSKGNVMLATNLGDDWHELADLIDK